MPLLRSLVLLLAYSFLLSSQIPGLSNGPSAAAPPAEPEDVYGRATPRGTVVGFLRAVERGELARATEYLEAHQLAQKSETLAEQLKVVLDRRFFVALSNISDQPEGSGQDDENPNQERLGSVEGPKGQVFIVLHRVTQNNRKIWLFSSGTLRRIPEVYADIDANWLEQNLPESLSGFRLMGIPLWRLLTSLLNLLGALLSASIASRLANALLDRLVRRLSPAGLERHAFEVAGPLRVIFIGLSFLVMVWISSTMVSRNFWFMASAVVCTVGCTWLTTRLADGGFELIERRRYADATGGDKALRMLLQRVSKLLLLLFGFMVLLRIFGKDPTTLIAGLGVGGIAIAFAAQKTLENLFGGVMIISDRPIRVGDYCRVGTVEGTVEDIGLRSTRIRTLQRTVVSIPNGMLATQNLENFGVRDKFLFRHTLGLRYETTPAQMRAVLARIYQLLENHPSIEPGTFRVRFVAFNAYSMDVDVLAYVLAPDFLTHLETQQGLLLSLMDIVQECGSGFAFPSQTMYVAKDSPPVPPFGPEPASDAQS